MDAPIHFVVSEWGRWSPRLGEAGARAARFAPDIVTNEDVWVVQTWLQLRARGVEASIGPAPAEAAINIVDGIQLGAAASAPDVFYAGCRGDGHYPAICQVVIHQNTLFGADAPAIHVPQWPQPALVARDSSRRGIRTMGFFGHSSINLAAEFRGRDFERALRSRGCRLHVNGRSSERVAWNDYSAIDLVLSVRAIPRAHQLLKPVSKLSNAWLARVPALIGPEPAVEAIRRSELDYLPVLGADDALEALDRLRSDEALYDRMVEHGAMRAREFSEDAVAARWLSLLETLRRRYDAWRGLDARARAAELARRRALHEQHFAWHATSIHDEYANLGFGPKWWEIRDLAGAPA